MQIEDNIDQIISEYHIPDVDDSSTNNNADYITHIANRESLVATGIKESEGKISYELDWEFIETMAARMSKNKSKYPPYNWQKPIEVEKLKQSLIRHGIEVMKGNYKDEGDEFGHIVAIALNSMMIYYQLKNFK